MLFFILSIVFLCYMYIIYKKVDSLFKKYSFLKKPETINNKDYPAFTRNDYSKWDRTTFFLCGVFLLPIRVFVCLFCIVFATMILKFLVFIFQIKDFSKPQPPLFIKLCKITLSKLSRLILITWGYYWISYKKKKLNPENYPYFEIIEDTKNATIVCNHTAFIDIFFFLSQNRPVSFISKASVKNYPFIGIIANTIQCVYVDRIKKESRGKCLDDLKQSCLLYTSPSPRDLSTSRMPSSA